MIKNIVMDMGNVLLAYDPFVILNRVCENECEKKLILEYLFEGEVWEMGDRGEITNEQRYELVKPRLPENLHSKLKICVEQWDICMEPVTGAKEFCERHRGEGYGMYVLSNACNRFHTYFPKQFGCDFFDGIIVSSDVHLVKPDVRIYKLLCETYSLIPQECVFIDDRPENVETAKAAGMQGIVFLGDYEVLEADLHDCCKACKGKV